MTAAQQSELILASTSPRRQAYLRDLGLTFRILAADVDETPYPGEAPMALAARLAESKAATVAQRAQAADPAPAYVVVAADTVVALGNEVLGKPMDAADATAMLVKLRNQPHQVYSAICVLPTAIGNPLTRINSTTVWMRDYSDAEIAAYVATGDPLDKAGAYAIQHPVFAPAASIAGCLSGVVGLPLGDLHDLLVQVGLALPLVVAVCEAHTHFACCRRGQ